MSKYVLLLENGEFATHDQCSHDEVDVFGVGIDSATVYDSLEEARESAETIRNGLDGKFKIYSEHKVDSILKVYSVE